MSGFDKWLASFFDYAGNTTYPVEPMNPAAVAAAKRAWNCQQKEIEKLQAQLALAIEGLEWTTWFCLESLKGKSKDTRESEIDFIGNQSREILAQLDKKGE